MSEPTNQAPSASGNGNQYRVLVVTGMVVLSLIGLVLLREVSSFVTPVFLGVNLVLAVAPLMHWLIRRGVPRLIAILAAGVIVYGLLLAFLGLLGWSVGMLIQELPKYGPSFHSLYENLLGWLGSLGITQEEAFAQLQNAFSPDTIVSLLRNLAGDIGGMLSLLATLAVMIFFLLFDAMGFEHRVGAIRNEHPALGIALDSFSRGVARYWIVTTVFGLIVAVFDLVALQLLGVPLAIVWAVFSFLTNYIPNVGFVIGLVPPALMALLANDWVNALVVVIVWSVINFVLQSLIQPKYAGEAVGVTATVSFLSLLVWAFALGPVGALLALPATLLVKAVLIDADPGNRWINYLVDARPNFLGKKPQS